MAKLGGMLFFGYYITISQAKRSPCWFYFSLSIASEQFKRYQRSIICFSLRIDTLFWGNLLLSSPLRCLNWLSSKAAGIGGDVIAFAWKT